jgi:hypothetical protein
LISSRLCGAGETLDLFAHVRVHAGAGLDAATSSRPMFSCSSPSSVTAEPLNDISPRFDELAALGITSPLKVDTMGVRSLTIPYAMT